MVERKVSGSDHKGIVEALNDFYVLETTHLVKICFQGLISCKKSRRVTQINRESELMVVKTNIHDIVLNQLPKAVNFPIQHFKMSRLLNRKGLESVRIDFYLRSMVQEGENILDYLLRFYNYSDEKLKPVYSLKQLVASLGVEIERVVSLSRLSIEGVRGFKDTIDQVKLEEILELNPGQIKAYSLVVRGIPPKKGN